MSDEATTDDAPVVRTIHAFACGHPDLAGSMRPPPGKKCNSCRDADATALAQRRRELRRELKANPPPGPESARIARDKLMAVGETFAEADRFLRHHMTAKSAGKPRRSDV